MEKELVTAVGQVCEKCRTVEPWNVEGQKLAEALMVEGYTYRLRA